MSCSAGESNVWSQVKASLYRFYYIFKSIILNDKDYFSCDSSKKFDLTYKYKSIFKFSNVNIVMLILNQTAALFSH